MPTQATRQALLGSPHEGKYVMIAECNLLCIWKQLGKEETNVLESQPTIGAGTATLL